MDYFFNMPPLLTRPISASGTIAPLVTLIFAAKIGVARGVVVPGPSIGRVFFTRTPFLRRIFFSYYLLFWIDNKNQLSTDSLFLKNFFFIFFFLVMDVKKKLGIVHYFFFLLYKKWDVHKVQSSHIRLIIIFITVYQR